MASKQKPPVLLVIDLQQGLVEGDPEMGPRSTPNLTSNVQKILHFWRERAWRVIHVRHDDLDEEHPLHRIHHPEMFKAHPCSAPVGEEPVLDKHVGSAFIDPELRLAERLTHLGGPAAEVVIIGMDGAQCINDNTRMACDLGFKNTVVADACATYGMDDYKYPRRKISAEDTHDAAMGLLANGFAKLVTTEVLLKSLHD